MNYSSHAFLTTEIAFVFYSFSVIRQLHCICTLKSWPWHRSSGLSVSTALFAVCFAQSKHIDIVFWQTLYAICPRYYLFIPATPLHPFSHPAYMTPVLRPENAGTRTCLLAFPPPPLRPLLLNFPVSAPWFRPCFSVCLSITANWVVLCKCHQKHWENQILYSCFLSISLRFKKYIHLVAFYFEIFV